MVEYSTRLLAILKVTSIKLSASQYIWNFQTLNTSTYHVEINKQIIFQDSTTKVSFPTNTR